MKTGAEAVRCARRGGAGRMTRAGRGVGLSAADRGGIRGGQWRRLPGEYGDDRKGRLKESVPEAGKMRREHGAAAGTRGRGITKGKMGP